MEIILVKIAALGLTERHLGKNCQNFASWILQIERKIRIKCLRGGGRIRIIDLGFSLFVKKIVIDQAKVIIHSDDAFSPVAYLQIVDFHLEDKSEISPLRKLFESTLPAPVLYLFNFYLYSPANLDWFVCARKYQNRKK